MYGPSGAGKKTRIMCILRELYGTGVERLRIEREEFQTPSNKRIEMTTIASNYHIEVNPSDAGIYDRVVIQELVKNIAQTKQLDSDLQKDFKSMNYRTKSLYMCTRLSSSNNFLFLLFSLSFKVIVLTEVDKLTKDAQHALRRTMEKYMSTCRLILCCNSISKVIPAVRSRCLCLRIPAPSNEQISVILKQTCKSEGLNIPTDLIERIVAKSNRNLRRALLMCETAYVAQYPFTSNQEINEPDWEVYVRETARMIVQQQNIEKIVQIRERLYELLCHCIPADIIFKGLLKELLTISDSQMKTDVVQIAAEYEHKMNLGDKQIFYLEAFVIKFMSLYKRFIEKSLEGI
jgi:replication factor C subunit 3/5